MDYLTRVLYENEKNYKNFTYKVCPEQVMPSFVAAYMRKNHFLVGEIDKRIEALMSNGLMGHWIKQYTSYKHTLKSNQNSHPSQLKMENLQGAFEILIYGLFLAFMNFLFEILVNVIKKAVVKFSTSTVNKVIRL